MKKYTFYVIKILFCIQKLISNMLFQLKRFLDSFNNKKLTLSFTKTLKHATINTTGKDF